mgnify:CR=1 FL=1
MNFADSLRLQAGLNPEKAAVVCEGRQATFGGLNGRANRIANAVRGLGLKRGDAVSVLLYNGAEYIEIFHALARIGVAMVPVNYRFVAREIEYLVNNSESKALIYGSAFEDRVEQAWQVPMYHVTRPARLTVGQMRTWWSPAPRSMDPDANA